MDRRLFLTGSTATVAIPLHAQAAVPFFWGIVRLLVGFSARRAATRAGLATVGTVATSRAARAAASSSARTGVARTIVKKRNSRPYAAENPSSARRAAAFLNNVADVYDVANFIGLTDEVKQQLRAVPSTSPEAAVAAYFCLITRNDSTAAMSQFVDPTYRYFSYMDDRTRRASYQINYIHTVEVDHEFGGRVLRVGVWGRNHPHEEYKWWDMNIEMVQAGDSWLILKMNT